jgi:hypothetical protein
MAKKPTTKTSETTAPAAAPAQPWAKSEQTATAAASADAAPEGEVPSEAKDQVTPAGENPSEAVNEKFGDGATGNGGGVDSDAADTADDAEQLDEPDENAPEDETTSIEKDEVTPAATNPSEQLQADAPAATEALVAEQQAEGRVRGFAPAEEVLAEAKDQLTPVGEDLSLAVSPPRNPISNSATPAASDALRARFAALPPEDRAKFESAINKLAEQMLDKMERNQKAAEMEANMVSGQKVYGNRARRENHDETLGGLSNGNVQLNRRARRQAERVLRERTAK